MRRDEETQAGGGREPAQGVAGEPRRRRGAPWLLGGLVLALLLVLLALQVLGLWEFITPDSATDTLLLYALSSLNFVAFLVFSFIFVRNLLKLRRERRERQLGSKIKTRLVVYFIAVSLLPITAMAVFSYIFFNRSLEKWFGRIPEDVVREAQLAREDDAAQQAGSLAETARVVAVALERQLAQGEQPQLSAVLPLGRFDAAGIDADDSVGASLFGEGFDTKRSKELVGALKTAVWRLRNGRADQLPLTTPDRVVATAVPLADGRAFAAAREVRPDPRLDRIVSGADTFEQLRREQRKVRLLGLSTLGLLTLLMLFAATWSAIHLARGIGTPIRTMAEAADEVARGNFTHRVSAITDDELALLADSFNQMTAQLEENRRRLEANAAELESAASELREKNLALDERRNYIEAVLESLSTGVVSLDAENRVTTINAAASMMLRLGQPPPPGARLSDLFAGEDGVVLEKIVARARRAGRSAWQLELARGASSESDEGAGLPVALTAAALGPASAEGRGVVLVIEDLTELLAAQRAAAWSEVARRMAHEIKNPLTPIQLSAERIARQFRRLGNGGHVPKGYETARLSSDGDDASVSTDDAGGEVSSSVGGEAASSAGGETPSFAGGEQGPLDLGEPREAGPRDGELARVGRVVEDCTETITREVAGLKAMVDEFSRFARLPHARPEPADLNEVVRQAVKLYEDRLEGVRLDVLLAPALPPGMLDPEQLRRALVNLIDNALEALADTEPDTEAGRRVTVATGHDPARGVLLVEVADTGHGIARRDLPRLFQPYFSTRGRGTGLGLAIVQRVVTEHGGRIRAEQNHPRGARFVVELPAAEEAGNKMSDVRYQMSDARD
jgi:two-component system, NtrC family, nitrogen regulation sensor histidine kinase NtrY